jgi:ribosomal-protein-alanine N-acetyltransferase
MKQGVAKKNDPAAGSIRPMATGDLAQVAAVERLCHTHPWSPELFSRELENPLSTVDLFLVGDEVAGYLCSWYVQGELEILNVAVAPVFRRRGVARELMRHVLDRSRRQGLERAFLEVRVGNEGAIALYRAFGFCPLAVRKAYYPDGEDALVMELSCT